MSSNFCWVKPCCPHLWLSVPRLNNPWIRAEGPGANRLNDRRLTARFAYLLGNLHCLRGNLGEARPWAARAVSDAEAVGEVATLVAPVT